MEIYYSRIVDSGDEPEVMTTSGRRNEHPSTAGLLKGPSSPTSLLATVPLSVSDGKISVEDRSVYWCLGFELEGSKE